MSETGISHSETSVNLASKRQAGYFERTVRRSIDNQTAHESIRLRRVESGGLDFYYQAGTGEIQNSYFAIQRQGDDFAVEFGREGDEIIRRVVRENPSDEVKSVLSERPVTFDEAQAVLVVMCRPKAFTVENPPEVMNLTPEEAQLVAYPNT